MQQHHIKVSRTARYFTLGQLSEKTKRVWIVCHGYGQLAEFFLKKFDVIADNETVIVAPEALSRFYLSNTSGRVGASWMTSQDRLNEIADYTHYLETLAEHLLQQVPGKAKLFALGFSQGVSTITRWASQSKFSISGLVLWAGSFPPELADPEKAKKLQGPIFIAAGTNDEYLTEQTLQQQKQLLQTAGLQPELHFFSGGHEINSALLQQFSNRFKDSEQD